MISDEICFKLTPIKDSHGLQCALVVANILPEAELLLVNIPRDSASQGLATNECSSHRADSDSAGYVNLDIRQLLKDLEPDDIHSIIIKL